MRELKNSRSKQEIKVSTTKIQVSGPTSILVAFENIVELAKDSED